MPRHPSFNIGAYLAASALAGIIDETNYRAPEYKTPGVGEGDMPWAFESDENAPGITLTTLSKKWVREDFDFIGIIANETAKAQAKALDDEILGYCAEHGVLNISDIEIVTLRKPGQDHVTMIRHKERKAEEHANKSFFTKPDPFSIDHLLPNHPFLGAVTGRATMKHKPLFKMIDMDELMKGRPVGDMETLFMGAIGCGKSMLAQEMMMAHLKREFVIPEILFGSAPSKEESFRDIDELAYAGQRDDKHHHPVYGDAPHSLPGGAAFIPRFEMKLELKEAESYGHNLRNVIVKTVKKRVAHELIEVDYAAAERRILAWMENEMSELGSQAIVNQFIYGTPTPDKITFHRPGLHAAIMPMIYGIPPMARYGKSHNQLMRMFDDNPLTLQPMSHIDVRNMVHAGLLPAKYMGMDMASGPDQHCLCICTPGVHDSMDILPLNSRLYLSTPSQRKQMIRHLDPQTKAIVDIAVNSSSEEIQERLELLADFNKRKELHRRHVEAVDYREAEKQQYVADQLPVTLTGYTANTLEERIEVAKKAVEAIFDTLHPLPVSEAPGFEDNFDLELERLVAVQAQKRLAKHLIAMGAVHSESGEIIVDGRAFTIRIEEIALKQSTDADSNNGASLEPQTQRGN